MPELPEVETVRRGLLKIAAKRKINAIDVYYGKTITNDVEDFRQALKMLIGEGNIFFFVLLMI